MKPTCLVDNCELEACNLKHCWCWKHYTRWRRYGDPEALSVQRGRTAEVRFWEYVDKSSGSAGCWLWTGGLLNHGYGSFRYQRKSWPAHRWLWVQTHGPIDEGLVVRHRCDVPACVNPMHHELGTTNDNSQDMVRRDRSLKGTRNAHSKLDDQTVLTIKIAISEGVKQNQLAKTYGVSAGLICHIAKGRAWTHIIV